MNDEIKEILYKLKDNDWYNELDLTGTKWIELKQEETNQLLDYITNLQQENEFLKLNNPEMNIEHFRIVKENKRKIDNLRKENEIKTTKLNAIRKYLLNNKLYTYKYDDEELFEITTDKKAKDDLLKILGDENDNQTNN